MKKRVLSILLVAQMMMGMFMGACVSAEEPIYQTPVDISSSFNSKVYLSKENEKTEVEVNKPDYFVGDINKDMPPIAINRDNLEKICTNGVLTYNGVNYLMPMPEKSNGGIYTYWQEIYVPYDHYTKLKILAFSNNPNPEKIYVEVVYTDGTKELKSFMINSRSADKENKSGFIADVGVLAAKENTEVSGSGNLYEYTIENLNFEKKLQKIKPGYGGDLAGAQARILALTCIKPTNNQLDGKIGEKLANLPDLEELKISDEEKLNGAKPYADMLNERNASEAVYDNLREYNTYVRKINELKDFVKDYNEETDYENIKLNINFKTAISQDSVSIENFAVTSNNEEKAFTVEEIKTDDKITGVTLIMENTQDYADEIKVVVSKNIKNAEGENITFGLDRTIIFKPTAPTVYIKALNKTVSGENTVITGELKNNSNEEQDYVLILGVYSKDNEMTSKAIISGKAQANETITINKTLTSTGSIAEGTLLTNFTDLKILNCVSAE